MSLSKVRSKTVPHLKTHFPSLVEGMTGNDVSDLPPLAIHAKSNEQSSYKEMWTMTNAAISLKKDRLYEAGGSAFWACTGLFSADVPIEFLSVGAIKDLATTFFSSKAETQSGRILYPTTLDCFVLEQAFNDIGGADQYGKILPSAMQLLTGHQILHAFYYSLAAAMINDNHDQVGKLIACARTATVRLRILGCLSDAMTLSMDASAAYSVKKEHLSDSYICWLQKYRAITAAWPASMSQEKRMQKLANQGVQFDRKPVNATLLTVSQKALPLFTPGSCLLELAEQLGREFRRDVLLQGHTKLHKIFLSCQKYCTAIAKSPYAKPDLAACVGWILESMLMCLRRNLYSPSFFTVSVLAGEKDRAGWCDVQLAKFTLLLHCQHYCLPLTGDRKQQLDEVFLVF
jgi:hypothetical protein